MFKISEYIKEPEYAKMSQYRYSYYNEGQQMITQSSLARIKSVFFFF
jgi:hypothetical protein